MERAVSNPSFRLDIEKKYNGFFYRISITLLDYETCLHIESYAGGTETYNHGSLIDGIKKGIIKFTKGDTDQDNDVDLNDWGLIIIASVSGSEFTFGGSLKIELEQPEIESAAEEIVYKELTEYMESDREKNVKFVERF